MHQLFSPQKNLILSHSCFLTMILIIILSAIPDEVIAQNQNAINQQDWLIRSQQNELQLQKRQKEIEQIKQDKIKKGSQQDQDNQPTNIIKSTNKCFKINKIKLRGVKLFSVIRQQKLVKNFENKCFDNSHLTNLINHINKYYYNHGYNTVQVSLPKQNITDSELILDVIEGKISKIIIGNDNFFNKLQKITAFGFIEGDYLNINDINQGVYQINRLRSNNAKLKIQPAQEIGKSNIIIENNKKFPAFLSASYDNLGNEFSGINRSSINGTLENILAINDQINLNYVDNLNDDSNIKDSKSFSASISIPYSYNNLFFNYSRSEFRGLESSLQTPLLLSGYSQSSQLEFDHLLLSSKNSHISTNLSLVTKKTASYLDKQKIETSERKLTIGNISLAISKYFKNGFNIYLKPSYVRGLKILNATQDQAGLSVDIPKAQFQLYKFYGLISKKFSLFNKKIPLIYETEFDSQISKDSLFGSEQFAVGGYYSVRSFRENYVVGDHGYFFRNKLNINLGSLLANFFFNQKQQKSIPQNFLSKNYHHLYKILFEPFYDYGSAKVKYNSDSGRMSGAGFKTIFNTKYFSASLTYSWAISQSRLALLQDKENKLLYFEIRAKCC